MGEASNDLLYTLNAKVLKIQRLMDNLDKRICMLESVTDNIKKPDKYSEADYP